MQENRFSTVASASSAQPSVLQTNRVLRNTYFLLSMTLAFSAVTAGIGMAIGLPPIAGIVCSVIAMVMIFFVGKVANSSAGIYFTFAFTGLLGLGLAPTLMHYLSLPSGGSIVFQALAGTAIIFFTLSAYVLTTKKDFSFMGGFLMVGLMVAVLASLALMLGGLFGLHIPFAQVAISAVIVLLMSGFILYDTSRIVNGGETNYIIATIGLYLNIYNLFTSLLHLVGFMNDD